RSRPTLEIGPDTILCSNAVIPLRAQAGFDEYEWVDGTAEREFTAFEEGVYWVRATDSCGQVQADTMRVTIDPATAIELGPDTLICPGDTLIFSLSGFSNYQWSQSSFIDCTNCPTVRFAPTSDTLLVVSGEQRQGCIASDSLRVRVRPIMGNRTSSLLCSGDTLSIGNQLITTSGLFFDTIPSGTCFSVDTILVSLLMDTLVRDTLNICSGDSVQIFGNFESTPGTYSATFERTSGCDSIQETLLVVNDTFRTVQTLSICAGDSTLIFGQFQSVPGPYFSVVSATNGCDSTLQVNLEINQLTVQTALLSSACAGADAGAGEVIVSQGMAPYTYAWSNGDTTRQLTGVGAGVYTVTVTDANGCSANASLLINERTPPTLNLTVSPETCTGVNDGTLLVSGDLTGQSISIEELALPGTTTFAGLPPGSYTLSVADSLGCDQRIPFTITAAATIFVDLPEGLSIDFGDSLTLVPNTNATDLSALVWSTPQGPICTGCPTLTLRPENNQLVILTLPDSLGCPVADTVRITVDRTDLVYVPNAFSPNGDGINDDFRIYPSSAVSEILRFGVYDRWGGEVFLRQNVLPTDALAAWDGRRPNGRDPSVGVYVYLVEVRLFTGEVVKLAGEVLVLR
ncbi:MAG: gliding motility-associated C-terminal domain-containing protein, partial [Bacteroidota bacterium]